MNNWVNWVVDYDPLKTKSTLPWDDVAVNALVDGWKKSGLDRSTLYLHSNVTLHDTTWYSKIWWSLYIMFNHVYIYIVYNIYIYYIILYIHIYYHLISFLYSCCCCFFFRNTSFKTEIHGTYHRSFLDRQVPGRGGTNQQPQVGCWAWEVLKWRGRNGWSMGVVDMGESNSKATRMGVECRCVEASKKSWANGVVPNSWMVYFMEQPMKMDDLGALLFSEVLKYYKSYSIIIYSIRCSDSILWV